MPSMWPHRVSILGAAKFNQYFFQIGYISDSLGTKVNHWISVHGNMNASTVYCKRPGYVSTETITMSPNFQTHNILVTENFVLEVSCLLRVS